MRVLTKRDRQQRWDLGGPVSQFMVTLVRPSSFLSSTHVLISRGVDPEWKTFSKAEPSWLAFGEGGGVMNEDLTGFEEGRIQWGAR